MLLVLAMGSAAAAVLLFIYLLLLRRELGRMTEQLRSYNAGATGKKLDVALIDSRVEGLAGEINRQSQRIVEATAEKRRLEDEFRQATANISHDIRTPLTSILGYIQLLESETLTPEDKRDYLAVVQNRTKRLQALIHDYFELSLIESPDYPLHTGKLALNVLITDILVGFYDAFQQRDIVPVLRLPEDAVTVHADESAVRRVMENLLGNVVKYAKGSVEIGLAEKINTVELTIVNDAVELAGSEVNRLFDRFYTADRARSSQTSGLGLPIARSLMTAMGGTITAELVDKQLKLVCSWKIRKETDDPLSKG